MWVKVLPADPMMEVFFTELPDDQDKVVHEMSRIVSGYLERVFNKTLLDTFNGMGVVGYPRVVMIVNANAQSMKMPINEKASMHFPNDYSIKVRGDAVLIGEYDAFVDGEPERLFTDIPAKWRVIHKMEIALETTEYPEQLRNKLEELVLEVLDEDVKKMYLEARDQMDWRTA